jgi:hypothetical protein
MRKIRGKELYKVWNTITGEVKSEGSTRKDAKSQLRLLRGIEKKGGSLKADQIKDVIDLSYNNKKDGAPSGYVIDKELSDGRVKVYKDLNSNQVIVAHRGSSGWRDWLDNAYYATTGNIKDSGTYKKHQKKHGKALDKYGAENVIAVGHSRAGKYVEELNRDEPVKEVLTYNKAVGVHDAFQKNPKNQTDIRSSRDLISGLSPFQSSKNKVVTIPSNTFNFLKAHGTSALSSLGNKLIGKGFKQMRVGDMRKFVKAFKKAKYGETWTGGAKYGKKQLTEMIRPMFEDDDIDELVGGSVWTDFVKDFSSKHGLKYACSLSKYKEPLKKAYKLFKDKKDWFEPMKIDAISGADPEQPNITFTITEPEPEPEKPKKKPIVIVDDDEPDVPIYNENRDNMSQRQPLLETFSAEKLRDFLLKQHGHQAKDGASVKDLALDIILIEAGLPPQNSKPQPVSQPKSQPKTLPPLISKREELLLTYKIAELKDVLAGYKIKGVSKMKKDDMIKAILDHEKIPEGVKWGDKPYVYKALKDAYACLEDDGFGLKQARYALGKAKEKLEAGKGGKMERQAYGLLQDNIKRYEARIAECEALLERDYQKEYSGSGILSGGNKWTDFVKDYAKSYNTTYGCALSDVGIKSAYKLFKDGKTWYFPKVSATIETQTEDFIEPEPTKAPVNIEPVVNRIEEKIKELEVLGASKGAVSYSSSTIVTDVAFINMMVKYGGRCLITNIMKSKGIELGIEINNNVGMTSLRFPQLYERLGEALRECIQRGVKVILIPLSLKFGDKSTGHANMLIYRPFKRLVERYEPHGLAYGNSMKDNEVFNGQLKQLWERDLKHYIGNVRYRPPDEYCPNPRGFQDLEGQIKGLAQEGGGFCSMWSFFVAEMTFINPDKSTKEILDEVYATSKEDPAYLKSVIRGYVINVEKGLDELLKTLGASGFTFKNKKTKLFGLEQTSSDQIYQNKTALEKWILDSVFDTKKYSEAPPLYEPLPDVVIREKSDVEKLKETYFDKMRKVTKEELINILAIYGKRLKGVGSIKRDDLAMTLIEWILDGEYKTSGSNGITDLDVILSEELHKKKGAFQVGLALSGYFLNKKSGGKINIGKSLSKAFDPKKNGVSKAFDKAGKSMTEGMFKASQGLNKINPMMIALNDKKTSKAMADLGGVTNDYLLPAVVAMGKPVYDATAMTASTMITGNPIAGKILADSLWDNMVAKKGIDPRDRQKSQLLGIVSSQIGNVLGKASGNIGK